MLKRKIYNDLLRWKANEKKQCLLVKGARQVGKTFYDLLVSAGVATDDRAEQDYVHKIRQIKNIGTLYCVE